MFRKLTILFWLLIWSYCLNAQQLEHLNPSKFKLDFKSYNQGAALFCAEMSNLVYESEDSIGIVFDTLHFLYPDYNLHYSFVEVKSDQALILSHDSFVLVVFRGTEMSKLKDWVTNSKIWTHQNKTHLNDSLANMPKGHRGFRRSGERLMHEGELFKKMDSLIILSGQTSEVPVYLTGHSLGAAISQLYVECVDYKGYNFKGAYHFAPPLSVSCDCRDSMRVKYGDMVYDIVNYQDYVPRAGRRSVAHFGKFYRICESGELNREKEAYVNFKFLEGWKKEFKIHKIGSHINLLSRDINSSFLVKERELLGIDYPCVIPKKEKNLCPRLKK